MSNDTDDEERAANFLVTVVFILAMIGICVWMDYSTAVRNSQLTFGQSYEPTLWFGRIDGIPVGDYDRKWE